MKTPRLLICEAALNPTAPETHSLPLQKKKEKKWSTDLILISNFKLETSLGFLIVPACASCPCLDYFPCAFHSNILTKSMPSFISSNIL